MWLARQYQVPRCLTGSADKHPHTESVESALRIFLAFGQSFERSHHRPQNAQLQSTVEIAPCRADPCMQHLSTRRAVDGLNQDTATWDSASAP